MDAEGERGGFGSIFCIAIRACLRYGLAVFDFVAGPARFRFIGERSMGEKMTLVRLEDFFFWLRGGGKVVTAPDGSP